jgi:signal transduction histidine kinase
MEKAEGRRRGDLLRDLLLPARRSLASGYVSAAVGPLLAAFAYYAGAMIAFAVGTLSDQIYAPFWPPNVLLFGALIAVEEKRWPVYLVAVIPAHILAELWVAMPADQMIVAYVTNISVAVLAAWMFKQQRFMRLVELPEGFIRILVVAAAAPAITAFGGPFVRILGGAPLSGFWGYWLQWYVGNALAFLTIGPILVTYFTSPRRDPLSTERLLEAIIVSICVAAACVVSLRLGVELDNTGFLPAILYLPLPFILWASVRFGAMGSSAAVLIVALVSIATALDGPSVFFSATIESTVLGLQLYLVGIAITALPLGAAVDELHLAQGRTRRLARSLLDARDEERRRIARELHDSTGQNLVAAAMMIDQLDQSVGPPAAIEGLRGSIKQSIRDIRTLSYLLYPPLLDEGGLKMALQNFVQGFTERTGIAVDMDISIVPGLLPKSTELILFRVIQEALLNVSRHSGSATASVTLGQTGSRHRGWLVVEDAGRGFAERTADWHAASLGSGGVGLSSMRERILQIGGEIEINSGNSGTTVYATFPIERRGRSAEESDPAATEATG